MVGVMRSKPAGSCSDDKSMSARPIAFAVELAMNDGLESSSMTGVGK
jgi:hypothetical protein